MHCFNFQQTIVTVTERFGSKARLKDEIMHHKRALQNKCLVWTLGRNTMHILPINALTVSHLAFPTPQMMPLLDRNMIISISVNKSEMHPVLSKIAQCNSLRIFQYGPKCHSRDNSFCQILQRLFLAKSVIIHYVIIVRLRFPLENGNRNIELFY